MKISNALLAAAVAGFLANGTAVFAEDAAPAVDPAKKEAKAGCNGKDGCKAKDEKKGCKSCKHDEKKDEKAGCNGKDGCKAKDEKKAESK